MAVPASLTTRALSAPPKRKPKADDSLLDSLISGGASGLQYVGESLNKVSRGTWGSANYLAGGDAGGGLLNLIPFSDAMGLTDPRKGIELSGFLENQGVLPKNQTGFDRWDIPRFALDVVGDPLSFTTGAFTAKSLGRGGSILAKASPAARKLSRTQRMTTTVGDFANQIPASALEHAATRSGFASGADLVAKLGSEKMGGLLGVGVPFRAPTKAIGTGKTAQKIGGALDKLWSGAVPKGLTFGPQRARALSEMESAFGPKAGKALELHDAYATKWAQKTGGNTEDYFSRLTFRKGDPLSVGADALRQPQKAARLKTEPVGDGIRIAGLPNKGSVDSIKQSLKELVDAADSKGQSVEGSRYLHLELTNPADQESLAKYLKELGFTRDGDSLRRVAGAAKTSPIEDAILSAMREEPDALHTFRVLREKTGIPKAEFDAAVLKMAREEKLSLHKHDYPHSPAETDLSRSQYVQGAPTSRYLGEEPTVPHFIGAAIRRKSGPSTLFQGEQSPGGRYVARRSPNPEADLKRGWSAWGGHYVGRAIDIPDVDNAMAARNLDEYDVINAIDDKHVYETADGWAIKDTDEAQEAVADWVREELDIDVARDPTSGQWAARHHEGLSSYELDASDLPTAINAAKGLRDKVSWHRTEGVAGLRPRSYHPTGIDDIYVFEVGDISGLPQAALGGKAGARGAVTFLNNNQQAIVTAFQSADISTLAHESGHVFRRWLGEMDQTLLSQAESALGVSGTWTRDAEEAFASGFERYLRDGQAPTSALRAVFESFKNWLTQVYQSIKGTPLEQSVNPQLKRVFDSMLTPQGASGGIRFSAPGRLGAALFSRQNRGAMTRQGQELAQVADAGERAAQVAAREALGEHIRAYEEFSQTLPDAMARIDANDALRAAVEGTAPLREDMQHLQPVADAVKQIYADIVPLERSEGVVSEYLDDLWADYAKRQRFFFPGDKSKSEFPSLLLSGKHGSQTQRADILRDIQGGTGLINRLTLDPQLSGVAHGKRPAELTKEFWDRQERLVNAAMSASGNPNWTYEHSRKLAKWLADLDPRHVSENVPVFPHNPIEEALRRKEIGGRAVEMAKAIRESVSANAMDFYSAPAGSVPVRGVLERAGLDVDATLQMMGLADDAQMPKELAEDIGRVIKSFQNPDEVNVVLKAVDKFTALFKTGVTALAPAFHVRNRTSGAVQNWIIGAFSLRSANDADKLIRGRGPISGLQDELGDAYKGLTDQQATRKFAEEVFAQNVAPRGQGIGLDTLTGTTLDRNLAADIPGVIPNRPWDAVKSALPRNLRQANPLNVAGVATETDVFAPAVAGRQIGSLVESQNRIEGYLELRRQGYAPELAAERVRAAHVDYANLSDTERQIRRWVPFMAFSKGMATFVADELLQRPGGRLGQTIRASNQSSDAPLPDYVAQTAAIPLGMLPDGSQRFLTGFGFAHEDTLGIPGFRGGMPDIGGTLAELGSRLNPIPKLAIEAATGESLFQRGPLGGRDVLDQDPTIGRLISNVGELTGLGKRELPSGRAKPFLGTGFEQLASNLPTSRLMTTLRTLTDKRKLEGGPFPGSMAALNTLTGARVSDVSPAAQDALLRDELQATMRQAGGSAFESVRFSKKQIAEAEKADPQLAQQMRDMNAAAAELAARAKARKAKIKPAR